MTVTLQVETRASNKTRAQLLAEDAIPAVVYGPKQETISLQIKRSDFDKAFKAAGESTIVELTGTDEPIEALIHDVAFHPTKGMIQHVDFYAFERGKDMTTEVPLEFVGTAPIEKTGGMINKVLHELTVTCRPSKLPSEIVVDISGLEKADQQITVADIPALEGVVIENSPEEVILVAQGEREEEPEEVPAEVDMDAVEVEEKGKGEEAEGEETK